LVDRGSVARQGQLLAELTAPEMKAQLAEAVSNVQVAESNRLLAEAQLSAAKCRSKHIRQAQEGR
jgi:multidrug resistance efflux pump